MKIGGPIRYFSKPSSVEALREDLAAAREQGIVVKLFGGGSNLIFADAGFDGLLIQPALTHIQLLESGYEQELSELLRGPVVGARYTPGSEAGMLDLQKGEETLGEKRTLLEMGAGVPWGQAVITSLQKNLAGLHWFARIPCQVGGAVYNNIHGERHYLSEVVAAVRAVDLATGEEHVFGSGELQFGYDLSRFHAGKEVITSVIFALAPISPEEATAKRQHYIEWTNAKSKVQPSGANCGSVFQNITREQAQAVGGTSLSAAWYIDQCGFRGQTEGGLQVYPGHANFITNNGTGTQKDFITLVQRIRQAVRERFSLTITPEVECITENGERISW